MFSAFCTSHKLSKVRARPVAYNIITSDSNVLCPGPRSIISRTTVPQQAISDSYTPHAQLCHGNAGKVLLLHNIADNLAPPHPSPAQGHRSKQYLQLATTLHFCMYRQMGRSLTSAVARQHHSDRGSESALLGQLSVGQVLRSLHLGSQAVRRRAGCWAWRGAWSRDGGRLVVVVDSWTCAH